MNVYRKEVKANMTLSWDISNVSPMVGPYAPLNNAKFIHTLNSIRLA